MIKKLSLLFFFGLSILFASAQINEGDKYFVAFINKANSPYSIENPQEFLSERAIERRERYYIPVRVNDLPVNPNYLQAVADVGVMITYPVKWLNGVVIQTNDPAKIIEIEALPFVKNTVKNVGFKKEEVKTEEADLFAMNKPYEMKEFLAERKATFKSASATTSLEYGPSLNQIEMIGGVALHDDGFQGQGMVIAVLDGGFLYTDQMAAFDSLRLNGLILSTRDFTEPGNNVYQKSTHGTSVLSTMGANLPGQIVGTAPKAAYHLIRTEYTPTEYLIEEYNWVAGAEYADSAGADIINSSLSYKTFDNPAQNHVYSDMDGNTAPATIGADYAANVGMIVVNSAGNSGGTDWPWVGSPADGDSVFSIGAVNATGQYVSFSSIGPTADGRQKPNVVAQGASTVVASTSGGISAASGTSFSSPIIAGMTACLWQMAPDLRNTDIMNAIQQSASQSTNPDYLLGYGIPNYAVAGIILSNFNASRVTRENRIKLYPNPFTDQINIVYHSSDTQTVTIQIVDIAGRQIYSKENVIPKPGLNYFKIPQLQSLRKGVYLVRISSVGEVLSRKILKSL
ncbi:MAG TPA: S8 family serine peptidase [Bacteroidales bacterium]|nr:S8 family serine peptidase [Bacteroidales bacterium]